MLESQTKSLTLSIFNCFQRESESLKIIFMKKLIICLWIFCSIAVVSNAKQTITLLSGEEIEVEIVNFGSSEITYKKLTNPDGPSYSINKDKIFFITHEDGTTEVINSADKQQNSAASQNSLFSGSTLETSQPKVKPVYYDKLNFFPRLSFGYQITPGGIKHTDYILDWNGFIFSIDFNILIPASSSTAWYVGIGYALNSGEMKMSDEDTKYKLGTGTVNYLTIPLGVMIKGSKLFTFGLGLRPQFRLSATLDGEKANDVFSSFRMPFFFEPIFTFNKFDVGPRLMLDLTSANKGKSGFDWAPSFGFEVNIGYRF